MAKYSVFNTLAHRAKVVSYKKQSLPILHKPQQKFECKHYTTIEASSMDIQPNNNYNNSGTNNNCNNKNISILVPYIHGLRERFERTCNNKGIQVHFKDANTIKTLLMAPKDRDNKLQKSGIIYQLKCPHINCPKEYIGEFGRIFGDRFKEHLRALSPIHRHSNSTGHPVSPDCFTIVYRESQGVARNIKEAIYIQINDPSLNRN